MMHQTKHCEICQKSVLYDIGLVLPETVLCAACDDRQHAARLASLRGDKTVKDPMVIVVSRVWTLHGEVFCSKCAEQWLADEHCFELAPDEVAEWLQHRPTCSDCETRLLDYQACSLADHASLDAWQAGII